MWTNALNRFCVPGSQIFKLELHRGWNSRLGFSLEPAVGATGLSAIRAIYADSVAARDGRLRIGDQMLMVSELHGFCLIR